MMTVHYPAPLKREGPRWRVVIPFKGGSEAKSRLAERFDDTNRTRLALVMLDRTLAAVRDLPEVECVTIVTGQPGLAELLAVTGEDPVIQFLADPGGGLNAAVSYGLERVRREDSECFAAAVLGDLPMLETHELATALSQASHYSRTFVRDRAGTGTTLITLAPGSHAAPAFGVNSASAHAHAGYTELSLPQDSGLRHDVDAPSDLDGVVGFVIET